VWKILTQVCVMFVINDDEVVKLELKSARTSNLAENGVVKMDKLPPVWYEAYGMNRITGGQTGLTAVREFISKVIPLLFMLTDDEPILFQCSRRHAGFYTSIFKRSLYTVTPVFGSMSGGPMLADWSHTTGGSNDEQVLMLEKKIEEKP